MSRLRGTENLSLLLVQGGGLSISPEHGPAGGGTAVTIKGSGFIGASNAKIDGVNIGAFAVVDDNTITGTSAAGGHGWKTLLVTRATDTVSVGNAFHYDQNPVVTSVTPAHGPLGGGTLVSIHGSGFTGMTAAALGINAIGDFTVVSDILITGHDAGYAAYGDVDATVYGVFGEVGTLSPAYHYDQALAHVNTVSPDHGTTAGGTTLQIDGTNFLTASGVKCGDGTPFTGLAVFNDLILYANTPAHAAGLQSVIVTNESGDSAPLVNAYNFQAPPFNIASLSHTSLFLGAFGGTPWAGVASAGISGTASETAGISGFAASVGAAIDGDTPAHYDNVSFHGTSGYLKIAGSTDIGDYIAQAGYTFWALVKFATATAKNAAPYANRVLLSGDARQGIYFSDQGVGVYHYTGGFPSHDEPCSAGAWHYVMVRYTGDNSGPMGGPGTVQIDVDNVPGTPTTMASFAALAGVPAGIATTAYTLNYDAHDVMARGTSKVVFSDADRDNIYAKLKAMYPSMGLP